MATKGSQTQKMTAQKMLDWWFDPSNGKVGIEYTDKRTLQKRKTKGFHAVTSGFNDLIQSYYGNTGKEFIDSAIKRKLVSIKPLGRGKSGKGIPGVMVYPYSEFANTSNKGAMLMEQMGLK